jgi:hypothetical protein
MSGEQLARQFADNRAKNRQDQFLPSETACFSGSLPDRPVTTQLSHPQLTGETDPAHAAQPAILAAYRPRGERHGPSYRGIVTCRGFNGKEPQNRLRSSRRLACGKSCWGSAPRLNRPPLPAGRGLARPTLFRCGSIREFWSGFFGEHRNGPLSADCRYQYQRCCNR